MNFIIMHQTVTSHDAIGNDIEKMYLLLNKSFICRVYAVNCFNKNIEYIEKDKLLTLLQDEDTVIIYHHSVYWDEGYKLLKIAKGKIIFRYHNITPESFFKDYNNFHYEQCKAGRQQTRVFLKEFQEAFWISDSFYNTQDLLECKKENIAVCPPFHKIEEWSKKCPNEEVLKRLLENDEINLLFVGRVVPNKGHLILLDILRIFCINYPKKIKLRIIGKFDEGLISYNNLIQQKINEYGISDTVEFIGEINDSILMSYYLGSDLLICTSEHEGFCVPIIEAQYFGLPILALDSCAVPETIGKNQIVLKKEPIKFAAAINCIYNEHSYQEYLIRNGKLNYNMRFKDDIITNVFIDALSKGLGKKL